MRRVFREAGSNEGILLWSLFLSSKRANSLDKFWTCPSITNFMHNLRLQIVKAADIDPPNNEGQLNLYLKLYVNNVR